MTVNNPNTDEEKLALMRKYPFLRLRSVFTGKQIHSGKHLNLMYNHYDEFKGTGWENLWKKYLDHLFKSYDSWDKDTRKHFQFLEIKEKYGTMRIYTSFSTDDEDIAEMLSEFTCYNCGKQPVDENGHHVIWKSTGYILPFCKECAEKFPDNHYTKECLDNTYAITSYRKEGKFRIEYIEKDGWLVKGEPVKIPERDDNGDPIHEEENRN